MTRMYVLHGLMGTAATHFAPQLSALADDFTFIPINLPGHGMTTEPATEDSELARPYPCRHERIERLGSL